MKKNIICILAILLLSGCELNKEINMTSKYNIESEKVHESSILDLISEDKNGDGKSVYWDGKSASFEDDEFDSTEINDGRNSVSGEKVYTADELIECRYPDEFEMKEISEQARDECHLISGDDEIFFRQINYDKAVVEYDNDVDYIELDKSQLSEHQTKYFTSYKLYFGTKEFDGVDKAGYVLIFDSNLDDRDYVIECFGLGNMDVLKEKAFYVMNRFEVLFCYR